MADQRPTKERVSWEVLSTKEDGSFDFPRRPNSRKWTPTGVFVFFTFCIASAAIFLSISALVKSKEDDDAYGHYASYTNGFVKGQKQQGRIKTGKLMSRISFGSCTTYYLHPQPIWTRGVIPSDPDAWIWLGDFAYADTPLMNCYAFPESADCNCETTAVTYPPTACLVGDLSNAREKVRMQLMDHDYQRFLQHMCPNFDEGHALPPIGTSCKKPILGTYDDHDFGQNNGNRHLENKYEFKNLFLDAIGEPPESVRRSSTQGLEFKYTLNADQSPRQRIDVFVLDQRYERDALPCGVRRDWCEGVLAEGSGGARDRDIAWCEDFLNSGGKFGLGSCCGADDEWAYGWCKQHKGSDDPLWDVACDPSSVRFGSIQLEVDAETNNLVQKQTYDDLDGFTETSTFCDVLGRKQRKWLQTGLTKSKAALKIIVSSSVLFGNPLNNGSTGFCSGDDIDCYTVAQDNLMHMIGRVDTGCVVVLTGDYHVSDLKVMNPGTDTLYSQHYPTAGFKKPVYQIMSSGLTETTARIENKPEECKSWVKESLGMRPYGECSVVLEASFGMMDINWNKRRVSLQHRSGQDGSILNAVDGSKQEVVFDLNTCKKA